MIIVHISGAPGSGKTTLGKQLSKIKRSNVVIKDLDDLFDEFMEKIKYRFDSKKYQKYIMSFLTKYSKQKKNIILVGLNQDKGHTNKLYNLNATHKFYIDIEPEVLLERLFYREIVQIYRHRKNIWKDYMKNPEITVSRLKHNIDISELEKENEKFDEVYERHEYDFLTISKIRSQLKKIKLI
jgi:adenylate kinase family enzyme